MTEEQKKALEALLIKLLQPKAGAVWLAISKMCEPAVFAELKEFFKSIAEPPDSESGK